MATEPAASAAQPSAAGQLNKTAPPPARPFSCLPPGSLVRRHLTLEEEFDYGGEEAAIDIELDEFIARFKLTLVFRLWHRQVSLGDQPLASQGVQPLATEPPPPQQPGVEPLANTGEKAEQPNRGTKEDEIALPLALDDRAEEAAAAALVPPQPVAADSAPGDRGDDDASATSSDETEVGSTREVINDKWENNATHSEADDVARLRALRKIRRSHATQYKIGQGMGRERFPHKAARPAFGGSSSD